MKRLVMGAILVTASVMGSSQEANLTPPEETAQLAFMVGSWTCEGNGFGPEGARQEMKGEAQGALKMGNRWVTLMTKDELEGYGTIWGEFSASYDVDQKRWVGTWRDSMSSLILVLRGEFKDNRLTMVSETTELPGMGRASFEVVYTKRSDDEFSLMVSMVTGGVKAPAMTNTYRRAE